MPRRFDRNLEGEKIHVKVNEMVRWKRRFRVWVSPRHDDQGERTRVRVRVREGTDQPPGNFHSQIRQNAVNILRLNPQHFGYTVSTSTKSR